MLRSAFVPPHRQNGGPPVAPPPRSGPRRAARACLLTLVGAPVVGVIVQLDPTACLRCSSALAFAPFVALVAIVARLAHGGDRGVA